MIDTDKYEGHTPAYAWRKADGSAMFMQSANNNADAELMADAPILLEEVKRLQEENKVLAKAIKEDNEILKKHIETLAEVKRLRGLLQEVADDYTDADGITYEIYCEFGGEEE